MAAPPPRWVPWLLLALLAAGGSWLAHEGPRASGPAGTHALRVEGPDGAVLFAGEVHVERGTAFAVLRAAADAAGLPLEVEGEGSPLCDWVYVVSVAGHGESGAGGWEYWVRPAGGAWELPGHSAACHALAPGDEVLWRWSPSPSDPSRPPEGPVGRSDGGASPVGGGRLGRPG